MSCTWRPNFLGYCYTRGSQICVRHSDVKVKGVWKYLYRAVDTTHTQSPRVIMLDKNAAYPKVIETLKCDETCLRGNLATAKEILE